MRPPGPLDEMVDGSGRFRAHWRRVLDPLFGLGREALAERARLLQVAFEEEGFASLLPGARSVDWHCDLIPVPIPGAEFARLEAGLAQRARLLQAILADVYGPQNLLAEGALPPSVVYANPAFLRPCRVSGHEGRSAPFLHFYAADLVRGPDGTWRVLADRTDTPTGAAYAIENRRMLGRFFPELFRTQEIWRVLPFFETWQTVLQRLAPEQRANPGVALLTPGHKDPAWFEHVLLARELSCRLVEAGDLTVRSGRVFLKTLRGLDPIDVLLRRNDGRSIDPLELGFHRVSGIPGLLDAARDGAVHIVNDPGAGFAEAPALAAFLPDLARRLLGEQLMMPSVLTLWLGDPRVRAVVINDLAKWLIRPALDGTVAPVIASELSRTGQEKLVGKMAAVPWQFVATASVPPSVAPTVNGTGALEPRRLVLRMFLLFDGSRWQAMRGGLARALAGEDVLAGPLPRHAVSKDVWVLAEDQHQVVHHAYVPIPPLSIRRAAGDLPARVAGDFFWLGRYLERLESAARVMRATIMRLGRPMPGPREQAELFVLTACLVHTGLVSRESTQGPPGMALRDAVLRSTADDGPVTLLLGDVARLSEQLRDRLTGEMYVAIMQALRGLDDAFRHVGSTADPRSMDRLSQAMG
ncbi:MAG: circularly permuted type 2 ATP-grasp protein, partial [Acetobacteraceae bacterium]|nr:circularly permuted type 2 ATP-grasp protein [Acetobacteraceae bacterium]